MQAFTGQQSLGACELRRPVTGSFPTLAKRFGTLFFFTTGSAVTLAFFSYLLYLSTNNHRIHRCEERGSGAAGIVDLPCCITLLPDNEKDMDDR